MKNSHHRRHQWRVYIRWQCRMECCSCSRNRRAQFQPKSHHSMDTET